MQQIITTSNINETDYIDIVELLHAVYCKEIPEISGNQQVDVQNMESLMIFFSNQFAYMAELWGVMVYSVRYLKRTKGKADDIDSAMAKRDFLDKVMSATKLKQRTCSRLMYYHGREE